MASGMYVAPSIAKANIGKGMVITGTVTASEPIFIDGKVEGSIDVHGSHLTIGPHGEVTGDIRAQDVQIMGQVNGNVWASNRLEILAGGAITGDVAAARLMLEEGAQCHGAYDIREPGSMLADLEDSIKNEAKQPKKRRVPRVATEEPDMEALPMTA
jgi:cytoskeletal protein CcmA (bactofilin family)